MRGPLFVSSRGLLSSLKLPGHGGNSLLGSSLPAGVRWRIEEIVLDYYKPLFCHPKIPFRHFVTSIHVSCDFVQCCIGCACECVLWSECRCVVDLGYCLISCQILLYPDFRSHDGGTGCIFCWIFLLLNF